MMKYIFFSLALSFASINGNAQTDSTLNKLMDDFDIYKGAVTEEASYIGGKSEFISYIKDNIDLPKNIKAKNNIDKVYIRFIVDKKGVIKEVSLLKGGENCPECVKAAIDVVSKMPNWEPAKNDAVPVNRMVVLPFVF
jgi:hypothetical protein